VNKVQKMQTGRGQVARFGRGAVATAVLLFVAACGGGGGSSGADVSADGTVPPSVTAQQTPTKMEASRFLGQATFGPNEAEIDRLAGWKVPGLRRQIGTVFQDFRLLPNKTVAENVAFALQVIGKPRAQIRKIVPETLELVGLSGKEDRMPEELSGGEQQRVAMARAVANRPMIVIADEPTGNLDPATSVGIMKLLDRINRTGTTVIMATHDVGIVDQMRKRVIELADGDIIRDQSRGAYGYQS